MPTGFADHFSALAAEYARYRPHYPQELFTYLAGLAPGKTLAWDCATGSGQAAVALAEHFECVIATDASVAQIDAATPHPGVTYQVSIAEDSGLPDDSVDLVTVAQALHWLDLPRFYAEAQRVLAPGGILAAWSYGFQTVEGDAVDELLRHFYRDTVGPYWPAERALVDAGYCTLPFPFEEIASPPLAMQADWPLPQLLGYLRSWSATGRYIAARGHDPVEDLARGIAPLWGDPDRPRIVRWPLALRVGRHVPGG